MSTRPTVNRRTPEHEADSGAGSLQGRAMATGHFRQVMRSRT
jgi:hypothetical protein